MHPCADNEVGVLLAEPRSGLDAACVSMRAVFAEGDTWITSDHLFRRDSDGDYWFVDNRNTVIQSVRGPVFCQPICDALGDITVIDLAVVYPVATDTHDVAVAAVTLSKDGGLTAASLTTAWAACPGTSVPPSSTLLTAYRSRPPTAHCRQRCERPGCRRRGKRPGTTTSLTATIDNRSRSAASATSRSTPQEPRTAGRWPARVVSGLSGRCQPCRSPTLLRGPPAGAGSSSTPREAVAAMSEPGCGGR